MAIKITNEVITDRGLTTELYINIDKVEFIKGTEDLVVGVQVYKNQTDRQNDLTCRTFDFSKTYIFDYEIVELYDNAFITAYNKLTEELNKYYTTEQI